MRRVLSIFCLATACVASHAQDSRTVYNFLRLPVSAHVAALGGENITLQEDDATLVFHNPSLINMVTDRTLNLNAMTYMEGSVAASASFVRAVGDRGTWSAHGRYVNYGEMQETNSSGEQLGTFHAKDIALGGTFAYGLADNISGGVTAKLIASYLGDYHSLGATVDLGLNYYHPDTEWSVSAVVRNLGGQLSAYDDEFERVPLDVQLGVTKRLVGSPLRLSATLTRLNDWQYGIGHHVVLGADLLLSEQFYIAAGYHSLRAKEMKISDGENESSHGAALSLGAGLQLERFKLHFAYAKYHVSSTSLFFNFSYAL